MSVPLCANGVILKKAPDIIRVPPPRDTFEVYFQVAGVTEAKGDDDWAPYK